MSLFDIFNLDNKSNAPIQYETFKTVGWTPNDYLVYKCYCEEIRAAAILIERIRFNGSVLCSEKNIKRKEIVMSLIDPPLTELFCFLQKFSDEPLPKPIGFTKWIKDHTRYQNITSFEKISTSPSPELLYLSTVDFDVCIETYISKILHDQPLPEKEDEGEKKKKCRLRKSRENLSDWMLNKIVIWIRCSRR